jgi:hypothetical protein
MALRPGGKVKRRPGPIGKPQPTQKGIGKLKPSQKPKGRPKPGSKPKGPAGGPKPKPSTIKPKLGLPPKMPVTRKAMGGQASEGAAKSALLKRQKTARQKEMMDMLRRLYGKQKIVPKKKPKKDK